MSSTSLPDTDVLQPDTNPHPLAAVLSQKERSAAWLGRKTGKSTSYVTRVMNGERKPSADFRARASVVLETPEALLFGVAA